MPTTIKYARKVLDSLRRGDNVLLEGPPAVSKSAIPLWIGKLLGQRVIEVTGSPDHSTAEMVGMPTIDAEGNLVFQKGYVLDALKADGILVVNEANLIPPEVMERLNSLLDDDKMMVVTENGERRPVRAGKNFRIVITQNPAGMRGGRKELSPALENKFRKIVIREGFSAEELQTIVSETMPRFRAVADAMVAAHVEAAKILAEEGEHLNLRDIQHWGLIASAFLDHKVLDPAEAVMLGAELVYPGRSLKVPIRDQLAPVLENLQRQLAGRSWEEAGSGDEAIVRGLVHSALQNQDPDAALRSIYSTLSQKLGYPSELFLIRRLRRARGAEVDGILDSLNKDAEEEFSWIIQMEIPGAIPRIMKHIKEKKLSLDLIDTFMEDWGDWVEKLGPEWDRERQAVADYFQRRRDPRQFHFPNKTTTSDWRTRQAKALADRAKSDPQYLETLLKDLRDPQGETFIIVDQKRLTAAGALTEFAEGQGDQALKQEVMGVLKDLVRRDDESAAKILDDKFPGWDRDVTEKWDKAERIVREELSREISQMDHDKAADLRKLLESLPQWAAKSEPDLVTELRDSLGKIMGSSDEAASFTKIFEDWASQKGMRMDMWLGRVLKNASTQEITEMASWLGWNRYTKLSFLVETGLEIDPAEVLRAMQEDHGRIHEYADFAGYVKNPSPELLKKLFQILKDENEHFSYEAAADSLGKLAIQNKNVEKSLMKLFQDPRWGRGNFRPRARLVRRLAVLRPRDEVIEKALIEAFKFSAAKLPAVITAELVEAFGQLGSKSPQVLQTLESALKFKKDRRVRVSAMDALIRLGEPFQRFLPNLEKILKIKLGKSTMEFEEEETQLAALRIYAREGHQLPQVKQQLLTFLEKDFRSTAVQVLNEYFPGWEQGIPSFRQLKEVLGSRSSETQKAEGQDLQKKMGVLSPWTPVDSAGKTFSAEQQAEIQSFIPGPEKLTMVGPTVEAMKALIAGVLSKTPVYLMAATGVGKNAMLRYLAHLTGTPLYRINFGRETDESQLYGHFEVQVITNERGEKVKRVVITDGKMVEAMKNGGWCLWDEANLASEGFLVAQNDVIQQLKSGKVWIKQGGKRVQIDVHEHFRLFATGNPEGYGGRKPTEQSFGSRWLKHALREFRVEEQQAILREEYSTGVILSEAKDLERRKDSSAAPQNDKGSLSEASIIHIPQILHALKVAAGGEVITLRTLKRVARRVSEVEASHPLPPGEGTGVRALWAKNEAGQPVLTDAGMRIFIEALEAEVFDGLSGEAYTNAKQALEASLPRGRRRVGRYFEAAEKPERAALEKTQFFKEVEEYRGELGVKGGATPLPQGERGPDDLVPVPTTIKYARKVLDSFRRGDNVLLEGPPAVSKSAIPLWLGKLLGQEVVEVTGSPDHSSAEMVGMPTIDAEGNLVFQKGYVLDALRRDAILVINEGNLIPPEVMERLNSLLDDDKMMVVTENGERKPIRAGKNFRIVITQNPAGMRGGRKDLSPALENKFRKIVLREGFKPSEKEEIVSSVLHQRLKVRMQTPPAQTPTPASPAMPPGVLRGSGKSGASHQAPLATPGVSRKGASPKPAAPSPTLSTRASVPGTPPRIDAVTATRRGMATVFSPKRGEGASPEQVKEAEKLADETTKRLQDEIQTSIQEFMKEHGGTLTNLGSLAAMKRVRVQVDTSGETDIAAMDLDSGVMYVNPLAAKALNVRQLMAVAIHEGGHGAISRVGDGFFFEKKSRHLLGNCLEDPRVNNYMMRRLPGSSADFSSLYDNFFPDPAKIREAQEQGEIEPMGGMKHEQLAHGFIDLWANGRVTERIEDPEVREALEQLAPAARKIWETHPDVYHARERQIIAKQNEAYDLIKQQILPTYERFYQEAVRNLEKKLSDSKGRGGPGKGTPGRGGGSIDAEDLSAEARKIIEDRAGQLAKQLEPNNSNSQNRNGEIDRARRRGARKGDEEGSGKGAKGSGEQGGFRPYDQKTFADLLADRSKRKQDLQAFYDEHPFRRYFDPVRDVARQVAEALKQVLKLDVDFEYQPPHRVSGTKLDVRKAIEVILKNSAGIFSEDDMKLFLRKSFPTRQSRKFVLVLDESGSMKGEAQAPALQAMAMFHYLMEQMRSEFAVVGFSDTADIHKSFDEEIHGEKQLDAMMQVLESSGGGGTNDLEGLQVANDLLGKGKKLVIGVGIGAGAQSVGAVYDHFYQSHDFRDLSKTLMAIMVKVMLSPNAPQDVVIVVTDGEGAPETKAFAKNMEEGKTP